MKIKSLLAIIATIITFNTAAEGNKHGIYLSLSKTTKGDISGKHSAQKNGMSADADATIKDGKLSAIKSFGYNFRSAPNRGLSYEFGIYSTKIKAPRQLTTLLGDDGNALIHPLSGSSLPVNTQLAVDSPSSYIKSIDIYFGALYNLTKIEQFAPYIGIGFARVDGDWHQSFFNPDPAALGDPNYGQSGKTPVDGRYVSIKAGGSFAENYNIELEFAQYNLHADSFRSLNINGADVDFRRTSLNFIYNF